jgi:hypothetical protein
MAATGDADITLRGFWWVGPLTVAVATLAVGIAQQLLLAVLPPMATWSGSILQSGEPMSVAAVLVTIGVMIFPLVITFADDQGWDPVRAYRRLALVAMLLSCAPNVIGPIAGGRIADTAMLALAALHVVAWAVTVQMLTRLGVTRVARTAPTESAASTQS